MTFVRLVVALLVLAGCSGTAGAHARAIARLLQGELGFAHRTANLDAVLRSGAVLSAHEAARRGLLESHELPFRGRWRVRWDRKPRRLRTEVFGTQRGILPADATYGKYGVILSTDRAKPSRYVNAIPNEAVIDQQVGLRDAWFVVPRTELATWQARYPGHRFVAEQDVPAALRLPVRDHRVLVDRLRQRLVDLLSLRSIPVGGKLAWLAGD